MSKKVTAPISIFFYLAFAVTGCVGFAIDKSWFGQGMLIHLCAMALVGILNYISYECYESDSTAFNIIRAVLGISALALCALTFFTGYLEQELSALSCPFSEALRHAVVLFPLVFILIRPIVYRFTEGMLEGGGVGNLIVTIALPLVCYALAVLVLVTSVAWGFMALFTVWFAVSVLLKGSLSGFERFLFNLVYHGIILAVGLSFAGQNVFATMAFVAASFCFFFFIGIDLFEETDSPGYWVFNVIGMLGGLGFATVALILIDMGGFEGMESGIRFGFGDAFKYAWQFTPLVYLCLRPPLYKLAKESEWEEGLGDVFVSLLLPLISYLVSAVFLLIGFIYPIIIVAVGLTVAFVVWFLRDDYPNIPDFVSDFRDITISITMDTEWHL
ncbi:MAG: hypothetical protein IJF38_01170 [Clostridia bacterium]|nr:hypothetical protein [Clostridia bacterium]